MSKPITKRELLRISEPSKKFANGCLIDTNILFGASYYSDSLHDLASDTIKFLIKNKIPCYVNVNIRAEFLNNFRRVVVAETMATLFRDYGSILPDKIYAKAKSLAQRADDKLKQGLAFRVQEEEIKEIKALFSEMIDASGDDLWTLYTDNYLKGKIQGEWDKVEKEFGIKTVSVRSGQVDDVFTSDLSWKEVSRIIEGSLASSADAMIINLFNSSRLDLVVTADEDFADVAAEFTENNKVICCL